MANCEMWTTVIRAICQDCDWQVDAKNGVGLGSQHANKTGHTVRGEQVRAFKITP